MDIPILSDAPVIEQVRVDDTRELVKPRRTNRSARAAGARFTSEASKYLAQALDNDLIEPRHTNGAKDRGDVTGIKTIRGSRVVLECKDRGTMTLGPWMDEAEKEAGNDDAAVWAVVHKRRGKGDPREQFVTMPLHVFARLLLGGPDSEVAL